MGDINREYYRSKDEEAYWRTERDPLKLLSEWLMAEGLARRHHALPQALIPVPLHPSRQRQRGFNQATELARRLGRTLGVRHAPQMCTRHRNTRPQSLLPVTARRLNLRNAFSITGRLPIRFSTMMRAASSTVRAVST